MNEIGRDGMTINLPTPTGDDQEWKRRVAAALQELATQVQAVSSQIGRR